MEKLQKHKRLIDNLIMFNLCLLILALPISKSLIEITASFAIGLWLFKKIFILRTFRVDNTPLNKPIFLYLIFVIFSLFNTQFLVTSLKGLFFKTAEHLLLFFVIVESINSEKDVRKLLSAILLSCALISLDGMWQYFSGYDIFRHYPRFSLNRMTASFQFPNGFGGWLIVVIPTCIALAIFNPKEKLYRLAGIFLSPLLLVCLVLTLNRGAWGAFIASILFLVWKKGDIAKKILLVFLIGLIAAVTMVIIFGNAEALSHYTVRQASIVHRAAMIQLCWRAFLDHPWLGHGINTFMSIFENYLPAGVFGLTYAHNCYLQMAVETGIFSLLAFLWIIGALFTSSLKDISKRKEGFIKAAQIGFVAGLLAYLVDSAFGTNLYALQLAILFYYFLGLAVGIQRIKEEV